MTYSDYTTAVRIAQLLNAAGARPRFGVRQTTIQRYSFVQTYYQVVSLP